MTLPNLKTQTNIFMPKGRNQERAAQWLSDNGVNVPAWQGNCLHQL